MENYVMVAVTLSEAAANKVAREVVREEIAKKMDGIIKLMAENGFTFAISQEPTQKDRSFGDSIYLPSTMFNHAVRPAFTSRVGDYLAMVVEPAKKS